MPYNRQNAGKGGQSDFVNNPDIQRFLKDCDYMKEPTDDEAKEMASSFSKAPAGQPPHLPKFVVASDASKSDTPINDKLPSTQLGFVKVSHVLIKMDEYAKLIDPQSRFVDPFAVADMHRNAQPVTYVLPGSNIRYQNAPTVRDGFRHALYDQLSANQREGANRMVLSETLIELNDNQLTIDKCPARNCQQPTNQFVFTRNQPTHICPACDTTIYATDWLGLHNGLSDFGDNTSAVTRMMNAVEHLLLASFILEFLRENPAALGNVAFVMDGPLMLAGEPSKLNTRLMQLVYRVNQKMIELQLEPLLVMGLQKTGAVMDHANLLNRFLPGGVIRVIDDDYRQKYITGTDEREDDYSFGYEFYYGQDFLFKTEKGRIFNFALVYPFPDKSGKRRDFATKKVQLNHYGSQIERACDLIRHFELDLYDSAIVPVALAHRHASISLMPGGKVLDLIARAALSPAK